MTLSDVVMTDSGNDTDSRASSPFVSEPSSIHASSTTTTTTTTTSSSGTSSTTTTSTTTTTRRYNRIQVGGSGSGEDAALTRSGRLAKLLQREQELIETLEALSRDIDQLEANIQQKTLSAINGDHDKDSKEGRSGEDGGEEEEEDLEEFEAPEWCVPIKANVMTFDWDSLAAECQFDVILMDPPWQLATHAPTRGVAIAYQQLPDVCIEDLPIPKLSSNGFIFIWVINNKYAKAFDLMRKWGYSYVDDITWVKQTVNRRMAKGHGYYLQHAKETCLVGKKGADPPRCRHSIGSDVIFSERRGQSQKPEELYDMIEELVPEGRYLEIFGRKNNLRDYWVTVGNEL
ncbi:hypothetical protein BGW42_002351 [Actinomortierella wolfii]|nr:hypothetical protein BGW42_002351 [Actinomortierella wolfii]